MIHRAALPFVLCLAAAVAAVAHASAAPVRAPSTAAPRFVPRPGVNAVLGDESYVARFGAPPGPGVPDDTRLAVHLEYVERLLRARDVSALPPALRAARARNLELLREYRARGVFPRNHTVAGRRPHFIDEQGRICAVGYLVEHTAGRPLAEAVNRAHEWDYVPDIARAEPAFARWAAGSGLTVRELAMIQPSYDWMERPGQRDEGEAIRERVPRELAMVADQVQQCADRVGLPAGVRDVAVDVTIALGAQRVAVVGRPGSALFRACVERAVRVRVAGERFTTPRPAVRLRHVFAVRGGSAGRPVAAEQFAQALANRAHEIGTCLRVGPHADTLVVPVSATISPLGEMRDFAIGAGAYPAAPQGAGACVEGWFAGQALDPFRGPPARLTALVRIAPEPG